MKLMMASNNLMNSWLLNAPNIEKFPDVFLLNFLHKIPKYKVFWKVCNIIFVLSHGQGAVERGFSINKELLVENLQEKSLVSQRVVFDHISSNKININEYEHPSCLLKSCKLSNCRYNAALEETKKQENWYGSQKTKIDQ